MSSENFLIILELQTEGFIIEIHNTFEEAQKRAEYFFQNADIFYDPNCADELQELDILKKYSFRQKYMISKYMLWGLTNGDTCVDVLKIDRYFSMNTFVQERAQMEDA